MDASSLKVGGEFIGVINFRTTKNGNLPPLSYIFRKLDPLGGKFKTVACSVTGSFLFIGLHRGKEGMKHIKYHQELGVTSACTKIMMCRTLALNVRSYIYCINLHAECRLCDTKSGTVIGLNTILYDERSN